MHLIEKNRQLLGDFVPQTPYRGFAPGPHWGSSVPQTPFIPPPRIFQIPPGTRDARIDTVRFILDRSNVALVLK